MSDIPFFFASASCNESSSEYLALPLDGAMRLAAALNLFDDRNASLIFKKGKIIPDEQTTDRQSFSEV